jgi:hypothetical protein
LNLTETLVWALLREESETPKWVIVTTTG